MTAVTDPLADEPGRPPATGADFAASFARSFPISAEGSRTVVAWFDLAIDAGRRQARAERAADPWAHLNAVDEKCGRIAVAPEAVDAVRERPDATEVLMDGAWIPVVEEYDEVLAAIGGPR